MNSEIIEWAPGMTLESIEKQVILKAFRFYRGNKTTTCRALDIAIRTLDAKLEKYELEGKADEASRADEKQRREDFLARSRGQVPPTSVGAQQGVRLESVTNVGAKPPLPVPKREEVQSVLPKHASAGGHGRNR